MSWDFSTPADFQAQLDWMLDFVNETLLPLELLYEGLDQTQLDSLWAPLKQQVKDRGLWAAHLEPEHGGQGYGQVRLALMHEILGRTELAPEIFGCQGPDSGNAEMLAVGASEAQRQRWLYPLMAGKVRSTFALTEPDTSGSDPTGIRTRCERDGEQWCINGHKWFSSNASVSDFTLLMAVTDPDAPPHKRASMLVVPKNTPGMRVLRDVGTVHDPTHTEEGSLMDRIGGHSEVMFEDCRVPLDHMIGQPGDGFVLAQKRLGGGRIHHSMRMIGQCNRAFEMLLERAASRHTRGRPLAKQQMVQATIADSYAQISMARLLVLKSAWTMDESGPFSKAARLDIAAAKFSVPRILLDVIDCAIQLHGALGYSTDMPLESMYRSARALRIADGADEVHKQSVARLLLEDVNSIQGFPSEHIPTRKASAKSQFQHLIDKVL
ncbi:MAG: acyl-CoA dehydrogenase family protein [Pseudomonadota bacterium]